MRGCQCAPLRRGRGRGVLATCCRVLLIAAVVGFTTFPTPAAADATDAADAEVERLRSLLGSLTNGVDMAAAPPPPSSRQSDTTRLRVLVTTPDSETHSLAIVSRPGWSVNDLTEATGAKLGKKIGGGNAPRVHSLTCDGDWMDPADLVSQASNACHSSNGEDTRFLPLSSRPGPGRATTMCSLALMALPA